MNRNYNIEDKKIFEILGHDPFNPREEYEVFDQTLGGKEIEFDMNWSNKFLNMDTQIEVNRTVNMLNDKKHSVYYSDREQYVRVYPKAIKSIIKNAKIYSQLPNKKSIVNGVNAVLLYLITTIKYYDYDSLQNCADADEISLVKLGVTTLLEECGIGNSTAKAILSFLVNENVIYKRDSNHYWVNYEYLYSGVRVDYIKQFQPRKLNVKFTRRIDLDKPKK
jgi:hypothetical protein